VTLSGLLRAPAIAALLVFMLCGRATMAAHAATLDVLVQGVRNDRGIMRLCLWTTPAGFPDCSSSTGRRLNQAASPGDMIFHLGALPSGVYAVTVFHDERNTGEIDTNFLGIPRSGLGASNNPQPRFGPPTFNQAAFSLGDQNGRIVIRMIYP
jgi:uncharacterized protein (DUF2141 family)